jgi:hypothetical protein
MVNGWRKRTYCKALKTAVGPMRTTPTEAPEVDLCQIALDLAATGAAGLAAYRLKC